MHTTTRMLRVISLFILHLYTYPCETNTTTRTGEQTNSDQRGKNAANRRIFQTVVSHGRAQGLAPFPRGTGEKADGTRLIPETRSPLLRLSPAGNGRSAR
jgi:hypothetical protein